MISSIKDVFGRTWGTSSAGCIQKQQARQWSGAYRSAMPHVQFPYLEDITKSTIVEIWVVKYYQGKYQAIQ